jgi:peptidyl-tRNA hydrolase
MAVDETSPMIRKKEKGQGGGEEGLRGREGERGAASSKRRRVGVGRRVCASKSLLKLAEKTTIQSQYTI